jgi:hypothetical protein
MSIWDSLFGGGNIVKAVGDTIDNLFTSDEERLEKEIELTKAEQEYKYKHAKLIADQNIAQTKVNVEEARSGNMFVAGWRPAIGWVGALALFYQFIVYPIVGYFVANMPEPLDYSMLFTIITGMLGIAGLRSYDKLKKTDTQKIGMKK